MQPNGFSIYWIHSEKEKVTIPAPYRHTDMVDDPIIFATHLPVLNKIL